MTTVITCSSEMLAEIEQRLFHLERFWAGTPTRGRRYGNKPNATTSWKHLVMSFSFCTDNEGEQLPFKFKLSASTSLSTWRIISKHMHEYAHLLNFQKDYYYNNVKEIIKNLYSTWCLECGTYQGQIFAAHRGYPDQGDWHTAVQLSWNCSQVHCQLSA